MTSCGSSPARAATTGVCRSVPVKAAVPLVQFLLAAPGLRPQVPLPHLGSSARNCVRDGREHPVRFGSLTPQRRWRGPASHGTAQRREDWEHPEISCWDTTLALTWSRPWEGIQDYMQRAANGETLAHLVLLERWGRVRRETAVPSPLLPDRVGLATGPIRDQSFGISGWWEAAPQSAPPPTPLPIPPPLPPERPSGPEPLAASWGTRR